MNFVVRLLLLLLPAELCFADAGKPQSRLDLQSTEDQRDAYNVILRKVFKRAYDDDVVVAAVYLPGSIPERACGILKSARGYEAFLIDASASTWDVEYDRFIYGDPRIKEECVDTKGNKIPCPKAPRKKGLPKGYRDIKTTLRTRPLPSDTTERIKQLWRAKLLEALHPPTNDNSDRVIMLDGASYLYSMRLPGHGLVTAEGICGDEGTVVRRMGDLADALTFYANGVRSEDYLRRHCVVPKQDRQRSPNHAMERTVDRCAFTFEMTSTPPPLATRALVRRRSSCSR